jgi:acyl-CoA dehydrogenase
MDFEISEDLKLIQETAKDFVKRELLPLERDLLGTGVEPESGCTSLPQDVMDSLKKKAMEMGFWGLSIPKELGGAGIPVLGLCLVEEALAQTIIPFNFGDVIPILFHCNEQQRKKYLDPVIEGSNRYSLALLEPTGASPDSLKTSATKINGHYVIEGQKLVTSTLDIGDFVLVFAVTDAEKPPREGVTCFLVNSNTPGLVATGGGEKRGWQAQVIEPIILNFRQCQVPSENVLGELGHAFALGAKWLPSRRIIRAARCVGVAERLLKVCTEYAKTWEIFRRAISEQTRAQRILADMAIDIQATRLMIYYAASMADGGKNIRRQAAMVKVMATEMVNRAADQTVLLHGGPAHIKGLSVERLCRNAIAASFGEKVLELQRAIIAREVLQG